MSSGQSMIPLPSLINTMTYEAKIATVTDTKTFLKQGTYEARIVGTDLDVTVIMTSPIGSQPTVTEYYSYAGLFGSPTPGTQVIIKRVGESDYWYHDSVPSHTNLRGLSPGDSRTITGNKLGSLQCIGDAVDTYSHSRVPQKYGLISPMGNKVVLSDSHNEIDRAIYAKMESKTKQRVLFNSSTGISTFRNTEGDGLLLTSKNTKSRYGPRSIRLSTFGNITEYTTNGQITLKVGSAGRVFNIINEAIKNFNQSGIAADNDVGSVNVESLENDITLRVNSRGTGRRIFIDATQTDGLVCIKAGAGGVEIYTDGDVNMACGGDFNINAGGDINMKGTNVHLNPDFNLPKTQLADFTKDNKELAEDSAPQS